MNRLQAPLRTLSIPRHLPVNIPSRTMATSINRTQREWMCIIPDKPGMLEKRMEIRPKHLEKIYQQVEKGFVVLGGATLDEPVQQGGGPKINGSVLLAVADSEDEVWDLIKKDIYYTSGVWDGDKIQVLPFKSAVWKDR